MLCEPGGCVVHYNVPATCTCYVYCPVPMALAHQQLWYPHLSKFGVCADPAVLWMLIVCFLVQDVA